LYTDQLAISPPIGQALITADDKDTPPMYHIPPFSANTPTFITVNSLYVYCDIVGHQRAGNASAQLMDIAPVQIAPARRSNYVFDRPTYPPVSLNFIEAINITIQDGNECDVLFPDDVENVVWRLHFD
jgi:hypothetical protein